jgi:hypothetical protein
MAFRTQPCTCALHKSPSSRARCRGCRRAIERGSLRLQVNAFVRPGRATLFCRCMHCIDHETARAVLMSGGFKAVGRTVEQAEATRAWLLIEKMGRSADGPTTKRPRAAAGAAFVLAARPVGVVCGDGHHSKSDERSPEKQHPQDTALAPAAIRPGNAQVLSGVARG